MRSQSEKAKLFQELHQRPGAFVIPNPWDAGSARLLEALGFEALATTSAGAAFALGRIDGELGKTDALVNAAAIVRTSDLPVSGDLENLYADAPEAAARTIAFAATAGLVGCSIEDATGRADEPIYAFDGALARVTAAVAAARALPFPFTLTARAENFLHGRRDLGDTIRRLQAFEAAGADVLYAPGLSTMDEVRAVVTAVRRPVNVLVSSGNADMTLSDLAAAGVKRVSVGGALARAALGGLLEAAREIRSQGTFTYGRRATSQREIQKLLKGETR